MAGLPPSKWQSLWPEKTPAGSWRKGQVTVQDGPWKLIVTHGKTTRYQLFNTETDPQQKNNLADAPRANHLPPARPDRAAMGRGVQDDDAPAVNLWSAVAERGSDTASSRA